MFHSGKISTDKRVAQFFSNSRASCSENFVRLVIFLVAGGLGAPFCSETSCIGTPLLWWTLY